MSPPRIVAPMTPAAPISDASVTRPGRMRYIHRLTSSAIGIVQAMVNVPQALPGMICCVFSGSVTVPLSTRSGPDVMATRTLNASGRLMSRYAPGKCNLVLCGKS